MISLSADIDVVAETGSETAIDSLRFMSSIVNGTYMLLALSPKLLGGTICLVPCFVVVISKFSKYKARVEMRHSDASQQASVYAQERLANLTTVHLSNMEEFETTRYSRLLDTSFNLAREVANAQGVFMGGLFFTGSATLLSLLFFSKYLASRGDIPPAHLNTFFHSCGAFNFGCIWTFYQLCRVGACIHFCSEN
jgi:ABC-type multidrug transport system fused ATPase/permease subunit